MTKALIYTAILAALLGAGGWYGSSCYDAGRNDLLAEQSAKAETSRKADDERTIKSDASATQAKATGEQAQAESTERTRTVVQTVTRIIHDSPAPAVCVVPPDSLRELSAAVDRANAAAGGVSGTQPGREATSGAH